MEKLLNSIVISTAMVIAQSFSSVAEVGPGNLGGIGVFPICTQDANGLLNIRSGPGQQQKVLTQAPNGDHVEILKPVRAQDGYIWYNVRYGNTTGWARQDYICNNIGGVPPTVAYVCTKDTNGTVNLRAAIGQQAQILTKASNGSQVKPVDVQLGNDGFFWQKIRYRNTLGWVRGDYLCIN